MSSLKELLLVAPDNQLDASVKPLIEKWDEEPKAIQVLEVLDQCIYAALASGFTINLLQLLLREAIEKEQTSMEELVKQAHWRERNMFNAFDLAALRISHPDIVEMVSEWGDNPTALQIFRVVDEIKLMRGDEVLVPYRLIEKLDTLLEQAMKRENITYKELRNKALWRDQEF